jgi:DNA-binding response OmpR family regulator
MKIAVLDNIDSDAQTMEEWLRGTGHSCRRFPSHQVFAREMTPESYDMLIIAGIPSPTANTEIASLLRENRLGRSLVIRVLESGGEQDIVAALKAGADDCLVKPVRQFELLARVDAVARRVQRNTQPAEETLELGNLNVDLRNRLILRDGERLDLTPKTYNLALVLLTNIGQLLSRSYLMERVWGPSVKQSTRTLDTHISRLRSVLGLTRENGWQLQSVYQHGYRLDHDEIRSSPRLSVVAGGIEARAVSS